jgi:hypothetical protein
MRRRLFRLWMVINRVPAMTLRLGDGRDALPHDPRQDVRWLSSGAAPLIVYAFRRVRRRTSTDAFQTCDAGRARVQLPSDGYTEHDHRTS